MRCQFCCCCVLNCFCLFTLVLRMNAFLPIFISAYRRRRFHFRRRRCLRRRASPLFHLKTNAVMTVHGIRYIVHVWYCISNLMSAFCVSYHDYHFVGEFFVFCISANGNDNVIHIATADAICKTIL